MHFGTGPPIPKSLMLHEIVKIGRDLVVLGGVYGGVVLGFDFSDSLFKLSCTNNKCQWETLPQKLSVPRGMFVSIPIPDNFIKCE